MSGCPSSPLGFFLGALSSVTRFEINEVAWSIAALNAPDILGDQIGLSFPISWRSSRGMGGDQDILHVPEGRVCWQRLRIGNVEASPAEMPGLQCRCQRCGIDHGSSPDVV